MSSTVNLEEISRIVLVNGMEFPIYDRGEGPVVLLLHGFPDSRYLWRRQIGPIAETGFRVIAPDLRGFGDAPKPPSVEDYQLSHILNDLTGLMDALDIEQVHLVGHDWGGIAAWLFAGYYPERTYSIAGLTVGPPGGIGRQNISQLEKSWYMFFFQNEGIAEEWLKRDNWQGLRAWSRENGDFEKYKVNLGRPGALTAGLNWYRANFSPASLNQTGDHFPRIKVPAMGIAAEGDDYLLETHVKNADSRMDASWEYHLVEDASHWLMLDQPDEINRLLVNFLKR